MRRLLLLGAAVLLAARPLSAQISVYDPANTARNSISASLEQFLLETERLQHAKLRDMARRLSAFADLRRFVLLDVPRWRTHGGDFLYANGVNDALIFGDPLGAAYLAVSHPVVNARTLMGRLSPVAQRDNPSIDASPDTFPCQRLEAIWLGRLDSPLRRTAHDRGGKGMLTAPLECRGQAEHLRFVPAGG